MDKSSTMHVVFYDVRWPSNFGGPSTFEMDIRCEFLYGKDGNMFGHNDLVDILKAYVQDEYGECPDSLSFSMKA